MQGDQKTTKTGRTTRRSTAIGLAALAPLAAFASAEQAEAATIKITNRHPSGEGSFNRAVRAANRGDDRDKLLFVSSLSGTLRTGGASFQEAVALVSRGPVTLKGRDPQAGLSFLGESTKIHPGPPSSIRDLKIRGMGIKIPSYSEMHISGTTIRGGEAEPEFGVYTNYYDDVSIKRTTISGFETGVYNSRSDISISESLISGNGVGSTSAYSGTEIERSTITGNTEIGVRAGYYGDADLRNSTVADNPGVGIYGDTELYNSTVTGNGGAAESYSGDSATFENSVVIGNERAGGGPECFGPGGLGGGLPSSNGGNVFGTGSSCATGATARDAIVDDARLGRLADNGGPTRTVALKKGSPAIGLATRKALPRDQRGVKRGKDPDSGAFERRPFRR